MKTFFFFFWRSPQFGQKKRLICWQQATFKSFFGQNFGTPRIILSSYAHERRQNDLKLLLVVILAFLPEVESKTQGSRPRPRTQKNSEAKAKDSLSEETLSRPRTGMLMAKAKDQAHSRKCSPKKKVFKKVFQAISNS